MSFRDYLHEKAEESRHNETLAYQMFLAGAVFLVGGILENLSLSAEPSWFLIIPYSAESNAAAFLGLALMLSGISLIVFGIAAGLTYSHDRSWYMQELRKANSLDDAMMNNKTGKANRRKKNGKP
jgi:heme/copper-type cytochrome/quinol oxidase subunit 1